VLLRRTEVNYYRTVITDTNCLAIPLGFSKSRKSPTNPSVSNVCGAFVYIVKI